MAPTVSTLVAGDRLQPLQRSQSHPKPGSTLRVARPVGVDLAHTDHAALKSLRESAAGLSPDDPSKRAFRPQFDAWPGPGTGYTSV